MEKDTENIDNTSYVDEVYVEEVASEEEGDSNTDWETEPADPLPESAAGLFSSPARIMTLIASILLLFMLTGTIAWLLGARGASGASTDSAQDAPLQPGIVYNYPSNQLAPKVGAPAPDFTLINSDTGEPLTLSSLKGKPVWINFWATWCHACVIEMPDMKKVYDEYRDRGLVILGVDNDEPREDVNSFTSQFGYDWTFVLDPGGNVAYQYRIEAIPTHWFVGRDGNLKAVQIGALPADFIKQSIEKIID